MRPLNEAPHLTLPQIARESYRQIKSSGAFLHSQGHGRKNSNLANINQLQDRMVEHGLIEQIRSLVTHTHRQTSSAHL